MNDLYYNEFIISKFNLNKYCHFTFVLLSFLIMILVICHVFNYKTFYNGMAVINEENQVYYIRCYIEYSKVDAVVNNRYINIWGEDYHYQIYRVNEEVYVESGINYQIVDILIDIPSKYQINNLIVHFKLPYQNKKIIEYVKEII